MMRLFRRRPYVWEVPHAHTEQWLRDLSVVPPRPRRRFRLWWWR